MPQFILPADNASADYSALSTFAKGYVEAMFFTSTGPDNEDDDLGPGTGVSELGVETIAEIAAICARFESDAGDLLEQAYARDYDAEQAGRDLWLTSQGEGVGFWDREALSSDGLGDRLSDAAGRRERTLYRGDDGLLYLM